MKKKNISMTALNCTLIEIFTFTFTILYTHILNDKAAEIESNCKDYFLSLMLYSAGISVKLYLFHRLKL